MAVGLALNKSALLHSLFQQALDVCAGSGERALDIYSQTKVLQKTFLDCNLRYLRLINSWQANSVTQALFNVLYYTTREPTKYGANGDRR